ncbi:hypothetical protein F7R05_26625 [Pseudomonas koreensis]|nr:hypothetical protein F7R05_26625 [Pseudomonas koreensis]
MSLLAIAVYQTIKMSNDRPLSRADSLLQGYVPSPFYRPLIEIPPRARRHSAPRPAFAPAPPVRLSGAGRCAA